MNSRKVIAIDGYASTGKSTLAKMLSRHYHLTFIDSGALYRGVTLFALEKGFLKDNGLHQKAFRDALEGLDLRLEPTGDLYLNGENISQKIRLPRVSDDVSTIAALPFVREFLLHQQRQMALENGLVMDGRDIGTVVFPNADHKFFFTALPEVRAQRRYEELKAQGQETTLEEVLNNLLHRDQTDSSRDVAPLRKADDA
ncbi:(d)CMP kinase, partial [Flavobacteriaceae bacterium]|nr:(d)CMP kinase [Flavobacteriaceae bacterium]